MTRLALFALWWAASAAVLDAVPRVHRRSYVARLAPYLPGATARPKAALGTVRSTREVLVPFATSIAERVARSSGGRRTLARQLSLLGEATDEPTFRLHQALGALVAFALAAAAVTITRPAPVLALTLVLGAPIGLIIHSEASIAARARHRRAQVIDELPVVAEQLGMLLGAGYSTSASLARIAERGTGIVADDLERIGSRIRHGLSEHEALTEWAELVETPSVDQLVAVLAYEQSTADLSRLLADTAASLRDDAHRRLIETIERRTQQVWIPVTVAALVPGVIFIAIPFLDTLNRFGS